MNKADNIHLRRQLLDWRDKHVENVYHHLNREIGLLLNELDQKIEKMTLADIFKSDLYTKKHLQPIYTQWIENEVFLLNDVAQDDLNQIYQHTLKYQESENNLKHQKDTGSVKEAGVAAFSAGAAIIAIPTIVSLSTATVSAGGFLGLVGVTTTVISWPIALAGITVVGGLFAFGGNKAANLKSNAIKQYKKKVRASIQERIIYNKNKDSVCQRVQAKIEEVTNTLLSELKV